MSCADVFQRGKCNRRLAAHGSLVLCLGYLGRGRSDTRESHLDDIVTHAQDAQTYYFARDDRVYKAFVDRIDKHKHAIERTCARRLKWQLRVLRTVMEGRTTNYRVSHCPLLDEEQADVQHRLKSKR